MLSLEQVGQDVFRAPKVPSADGHLWGGQIAAQALRAAILTVPSDRAVHSLHGYFLARGSTSEDIDVAVDRDRDGGAFSARRVVARQKGVAIFTGALSFHRHERGAVYEPPISPDIPGPDNLREGKLGPTEIFEVRPLVTGISHPNGITPAASTWVRARGELPDDDVVHACALTYISDFASGFARIAGGGMPWAGASLDFSVWYHQPIRIDNWVLVDLHPLRASGARGTYIGTVHTQGGDLGCVHAQEMLLRIPAANVDRQKK